LHVLRSVETGYTASIALDVVAAVVCWRATVLAAVVLCGGGGR
jgi:hypothetical protein